LEKKNFLVNIIANNRITSFDGQGKPLKKEMKQIYQAYTAEALSEVQKVRNDMLL